MIPRLENKPVENLLPPPGFFERLIEAGFNGDLEAAASTRTVYSTDNSIYQIAPQGVIFPKGMDDLKILVEVLSEPRFGQVTICPRGGGTGTNGQSLTSGIVVDCSRYMNRILEIEPVRRIARVEAGVVKDQLNKALKPYGLFFAPELSTSNRATIGGMVSTDACGQGSCLYGKTSNHVLGLNIVLADGHNWWSRPLDRAGLAEMTTRGDRIGEIYRTVDRIERENRSEIARIFPRLNRYMTGYDLAHLRREDDGIDLNAILCGSEGTLALIAEAELNLLPIPAHASLVNVRYDDFNAALRHARTMVTLNVASVETVDETVLKLAKSDMVWASVAHFFPNEADGTARGINIVEVLADDPSELEQKLAVITETLDLDAAVSHKGYTVAREPADIQAIWSMRKRAVGLLGNVSGASRPVPFVEDTAVPPENLADYIAEFRALLDAEELSYGMFGHVDAGVLHVRPALDLTRKDHEALVRKVSDSVVALTRKYGGVLWGEHGKGVRSEYVPEFFGPLYPCLQQIKQAFDPADRLNPGKIATTSGELLKIDEVPLRGQFDRTIAADIRNAFDNAVFCNGNGACFDFDDTSLMCPSYKATRDRRLSPKGRASLMREWLRQISAHGIDPRAEAQRLRARVSIFAAVHRWLNAIDPRNRRDFSHDVREAMDSCLSCKACAGQCPVKVNVPSFRAKFLELYYSRYPRPAKDLVIASIERILPLAARIPVLFNLASTTGLGRSVLRSIGLTALPQIAASPIKPQLQELGVQVATLERMTALSPARRERSVVLVADAFTSSFDKSVIVAAVELARKLGFEVYLAPPHINGKALHVHGYLGGFEKAARCTAQTFTQLQELGITLVGIDPSMTLVFRSEYNAVLPDGKLSVLLPQEWLSAHLERLRGSLHLTPISGHSHTLIGHCSERTNVSNAVADWQRVFRSLGIELSSVDAGCCGMAGTFGHELGNRPTSEKLYSMSWAQQVKMVNDAKVLMATGYSCRSQVKLIDEKHLPHPIEVLNQLVEMPV